MKQKAGEYSGKSGCKMRLRQNKFNSQFPDNLFIAVEMCERNSFERLNEGGHYGKDFNSKYCCI